MDKLGKITLYNADCMEIMKSFTDKQFDLAIVDPPYGLGIDGQKQNNTNKNTKHNRKEHKFKCWDNEIPNENYFKELFRVSKDQIIWGGNFFTKYLSPTKAWIFWYKGQNGLTMSDGEMAWTSFKTVTRQVDINRAQLIKQNTFHPTEKPFKLYKWLLKNYAHEGNTILDTHLGSGSSAIAAHDGGFEFTGIELDEEYYKLAKDRIIMHQRQLNLFR